MACLSLTRISNHLQWYSILIELILFSDNQQRCIGDSIEDKPENFEHGKELIDGQVKIFTSDVK
jgi:hypothetical protein